MVPALKRAKLNAELHVYSSGGHGFGGHIDHMRFAALREMGEIGHHTAKSHRPRGTRGLALQEQAGRRGDILLPHQRFAHEEGEDAATLEPQTILVAENAALADDNAVLRHAC